MSFDSQPWETQALSIIYFKGFTVQTDINERHCALAIDHVNSSQFVWRRNMLDIEGSAKQWSFRESADRNLDGSRLIPKRLHVKDMPIDSQDPWSEGKLRDCIASVAMDNADDEWNSQAWLLDCLKALAAAGFLARKDVMAHFDQACDIMVLD